MTYVQIFGSYILVAAVAGGGGALSGYWLGARPPAVVPPDICADDRCLCDDSDEVAVAIAREVAESDCSGFTRVLAFDGYRQEITMRGVLVSVRCPDEHRDPGVVLITDTARVTTPCYAEEICRAIERAKAAAIAKAWAGEP